VDPFLALQVVQVLLANGIPLARAWSKGRAEGRFAGPVIRLNAELLVEFQSFLLAVGPYSQASKGDLQAARTAFAKYRFRLRDADTLMEETEVPDGSLCEELADTFAAYVEMAEQSILPSFQTMLQDIEREQKVGDLMLSLSLSFLAVVALEKRVRQPFLEAVKPFSPEYAKRLSEV